MTTLELDRVFQGGRVPGWLREVEAEPEAALQDLLLGRAALGHLNADEPSEVLLDWLDHLGSPFAAQVDAGLAFWIGRSWGKPTLALPGASPAVVARAWMRAADLIAFGPGLERSAQSLRVLFLKEPSFLRALAEGRPTDLCSRNGGVSVRYLPTCPGITEPMEFRGSAGCRQTGRSEKVSSPRRSRTAWLGSPMRSRGVRETDG
jgi:hypothetical protein